MKIKLLAIGERVRSSFWFMPSLMGVSALLVSWGTIAFDERHGTGPYLPAIPWIRSGDIESAGQVLSVIAGSMATIAGVVFSMTLIALSLASSQFGPRLLRSFMRDKVTQYAMGLFLSTFLYAVIILRTLRQTQAETFVPHLSVTVAILLAVISLGVLIYFVHKVSLSIHADQIISKAYSELTVGIDNIFPERMGAGGKDSESHKESSPFPEDFEEKAWNLNASSNGYLQFIGSESLMATAGEENLRLEILQSPGKFITEGKPLAKVYPEKNLNDSLKKKLAHAFIVDQWRTPAQDVEYAIGQLVEIAIRALSPGINDPFTAITCLDYLSSALIKLSDRKVPSRFRFDKEGVIRIMVPAVQFEDFFDHGFNQFRQYGRKSVSVTIHVLDVLIEIASSTQRDDIHKTLRKHGDMTYQSGKTYFQDKNDKEDLRERYDKLNSILDQKSL